MTENARVTVTRDETVEPQQQHAICKAPNKTLISTSTHIFAGLKASRHYAVEWTNKLRKSNRIQRWIQWFEHNGQHCIFLQKSRLLEEFGSERCNGNISFVSRESSLRSISKRHGASSSAWIHIAVVAGLLHCKVRIAAVDGFSSEANEFC